LDRLKAQLNVWSGAAGAGVNVQTTRPNLPGVLRLVAEILREPAFPDAEFEPVRQARLANIEGNRKEPNFQATNELRRHLNPYPKGDVRAVKTPDEEIAECKQVTLADVRTFYRDFYGASNAEMAVVGDFDAEEIRKLAADLFGQWKSPRPFERVPAPYAKIEPVVRTIESPDKANAMFAAGASVNLSQTDADYPALLFANVMIGGSYSSRLLDRFRKKEGWSYGTFSALWVSPKENGGNFTMTAILNPQNMVKLEQAFQEEMGKVMKDGFTAAEVAESKKSWLQEQMLNRTEDRASARTLANNDFLGRTMAWDAAIEKKVDALTPEEINAAVRRRLDLNALTIVKAGDFTKAGVRQSP
jgi:zinc protease